MKAIHWITLALLVAALLLIGYWAVNPGNAPTWTGFGLYDEAQQGPRAKTLWDWLDLIIIPIVLAMGAWLFTAVDKDVEGKLEADRQRQDTLEALFGRISNLLLERRLMTSKLGDETRGIARSYALSAFRGLDPSRKARALQFLYETNLVGQNPIINLNGASLQHIVLNRAHLVGAEIKGAYMEHARLKDSNLNNTNFCGSDLACADFRGAILENTDLSFACLDGADLRDCDLSTANLRGATLIRARLSGAKILPQQIEIIASLAKTQYSKEGRSK